VKLLADVNIIGHVDRLVARMQGQHWREFWDYLELRILTFAEAGLEPGESDSHVWKTCQQQQIILLTNNRNDDGPDSLEATIRQLNQVDSLPVFTIGDADGILRNQEYAETLSPLMTALSHAGPRAFFCFPLAIRENHATLCR
jgi:hypothetical protein